MIQLPNPHAKNIKTDNHEGQHPKLLILDDKQWLYIQNRYNLTPRERQIIELICHGLREKNVAMKLKISIGTVKTHIRNISRKVRVKSKIDMLLRFFIDIRELSKY